MRLAAFVIGSIGILFAGPALAQTSRLVAPKSVVPPMSQIDVQDVQGRREVLFQTMLEKPDDLDAAFEYAALSVKAGDLEAAISTLERMLIFAPGLPRLQLELGVLYYRLSAYETARSYFEAAVSAPDVPEEVRGKVEQYLAAIDYAGKTTRFAGQVRAGIRYQTNANRAPTDGVVILNGSPFVLDSAALGSPDGNVYGASVLHYSANLPSQGDTLEADLVTYGSKQFHREDLDVALGELTVGPAFDLRRFGIDNGAIGFYGIASTVFIEGHFYSTGFGAGTRLVLQPGPGFSWITAVEYRQRDYHNSDASPTAELRDGSEIRAYTYVNYVVSPTLLWTGNAYIQYDSARVGYLAYTEAGFSAGPSISFDAPVGEGDPWIFSPNAGLVYRSYDSPDPIVSLTETEHDLELFIGADLMIPCKDNWGLLAETEYRHVDSNYSTRDYDNLSISLSVVKSF
jgi:tetratricopeptide (TPR) repeat protein